MLGPLHSALTPGHEGLREGGREGQKDRKIKREKDIINNCSADYFLYYLNMKCPKVKALCPERGFPP